jgi:hypothetical protein
VINEAIGGCGEDGDIISPLRGDYLVERFIREEDGGRILVKSCGWIVADSVNPSNDEVGVPNRLSSASKRKIGMKCFRTLCY